MSKKTFPLRDGGEGYNAEYEKTRFIWRLYKYLGEKERLMMGDMILPVDRLEENFTSEYILQQLHSENRFDFEYAASEGDNLQIRKEYLYKKINVSRLEQFLDPGFKKFNIHNGPLRL